MLPALSWEALHVSDVLAWRGRSPNCRSSHTVWLSLLPCWGVVPSTTAHTLDGKPMHSASRYALCKMAGPLCFAGSVCETWFNWAFPKSQQCLSAHHQLNTHQPLHHQAPQPLKTRTTNLSRCLPCCRLFALAWLVRQLRACCRCIGMVQYFDTAGAFGWGKAAQMLQAPHLQVGRRLGPAVGSHCKALILALDRLHQTECVASQSPPATCQQDMYASSGLIPQLYILFHTAGILQSPWVCTWSTCWCASCSFQHSRLNIHISDRNKLVPSFTQHLNKVYMCFSPLHFHAYRRALFDNKHNKLWWDLLSQKTPLPGKEQMN